MKKRPWTVWLVGVALIVSPVYYYAEQIYFGRGRWSDPAAMIEGIQLPKLIGIALAPIAGILVLLVRPISWYSIIGYAVYTTAVNAVSVATGRMPAWAFALNLPIALVVVLYFVRREVWSPYFNPRLRWWESDRLDVRAKAEIASGEGSFAGEAVNISSTGVFIASERAVPVGESFELTVALPGGPVKARAQAVWVSDGSNRPKGFGARFDAPSSVTLKAALKHIAPRGDKRVPLELRAVIKVRGTGKETAVRCTTFDISPGGCFLCTDAVFAAGERLSMALQLVDEPIDVEGEVVWVSDGTKGTPKGLGVRFARRSAPIAEQLKELRPSEVLRAQEERATESD